ncbi:M48 family peptidase [Salicibibacter halophilus]|uniref:M48 family peptidase n=1 Tax=Salicibibacter halophilus TaxID=2502791 RepID=A0A514LFY4_9BACI|nr:SprT family zinc-dependent metalloprotease [Salicibibacter halophilus]QDI90767.1 M48 family peptidase [Salicibibacter halophilus]
MPSFNYGNTTIDYSLHYQAHKKDVSIAVEWLDGVQVTAPPDISTEKLHEVLRKKAPWIIEKWYEFNEIAIPSTPKEFVSGEKFPYLGRQYRLKVYNEGDRSNAQLAFKNGKFYAYIPENITNNEKCDQLHILFKNWYIQYGQRKVNERAKQYCEKLNVSPSKVSLKDQRMRWGSCTKEGAIYLNWKIVMAPVSVLDYVVVHELSHLKYADHSKNFWGTVHSILPDYEKRKEWLRVNGPTLHL